MKDKTGKATLDGFIKIANESGRIPKYRVSRNDVHYPYSKLGKRYIENSYSVL